MTANKHSSNTPSAATTSSALYTDLSGYYDLMCADIDYHEQSNYVRRLHDLLGNKGKHYLDLACGTGPHIRHFIDFGYTASGVDINQPMLDLAHIRCPEAQFAQQDMSKLDMDNEMDLISCFLYSIHYNQSIATLTQCITNVHRALKPGGLFCFNAVDKSTIDNRPGIKRQLTHEQSDFCFQSNWYYRGDGDQQQLQLAIERTTQGITEHWRDQHPMVAITFSDLQAILAPLFEVLVFTHDYQTITPWETGAGNAFFVAIKH
ncbi:class I SAM-dependent methyltransferase [Cellvibrio sp. UBA7661]|uniref:class I SAM-dependent DNA methyltransferase n=1 Tax=Cellvibrio sp. UBA7661 TaxID=1946311 RepID=UPI002F358586